jgi:hypothetical protein
MILDVFQQRGLKRFVFILFCITVLFWQKVIVLGAVDSPQSIIAVDKFLNNIVGDSIYFAAIAKILLLLICSYSFIFMLSIHDVLPNRKYLATVLFLAIISIFTNAQNIVNITFALTFQMFAFYNIFRTYRNEKVKSSVFIAAFLIGLSVTFSFPFAVSIINVIIGLWIFSIVKWRNIISVFFGLITPFAFLFSFYHLMYHDINLIFHTIEINFNHSTATILNFADFKNITTFLTGFIFLVILLFMPKINHVKYAKNVHKKTDQMFCFTFFLSVLIMVFLFGAKLYGIMLFGISTAYLITRFSQLVKRRWFVESVVCIILLIALVYNNYIIFMN